MSAPARLSQFGSASAQRRFVHRYDATAAELWPVPARTQEMPTAFGRVHVRRCGVPGAPPVVLLSGAGGNALMWYRSIGRLATCRDVVAVDPIGEPGRSVQTRPIIEGADVAAWLDTLLSDLDLTDVHLVGSSYGGWSAFQVARHRPQRVGRLTLVDPAGLAPLSGRFYRWLVVAGLAGLAPAVVRRRLARRLPNGTLLETELLRLGVAAASFRRRLPAATPLTDADLSSLSTPTRILLGERSALHDSAAVRDRLAAVQPAIEVEIVPHTGHALPLEAPDLIVDRVLAEPPAADHCLRHPG